MNSNRSEISDEELEAWRQQEKRKDSWLTILLYASWGIPALIILAIAAYMWLTVYFLPALHPTLR